MSNPEVTPASFPKKYLQTKLSFAPASPRIATATTTDNENKRLSSSSSQSSMFSNKKLKSVSNTIAAIKIDDKQTVAKDKLKLNKHNNNITTPDENSRVFSFSKPQPIDPPTLSQIPLLYSQEELWIRLQIREFVFRFGDYFEIDTRAATSLQNVQGNWRVKRLAVNLTYQLLTHMEQGMIDVTLPSSPSSSGDSFLHGARTPQQMASRVIHKWMDQYGLTNNRYLEKEAARVAFVENLERDGLSVDHWADLIELLALLNGIPLTSNSDDDQDKDDEDDEDQQLPEPEQVVHSLFEELKMLQMVCDMLLMHNSLRRIWVHEDQPAKELRAIEAELKAERRRLGSLQREENEEEEEEGKKNSTNKVKAERLQVEKRYIDVMSAQQRNNKRFGPVGRDSKGNEYWIFNDLVTYGNDARNSEPYWGHGVIIIGPGLSDNASPSTEQEQEQRWWYLTGVDDLNQLRRWIVQDRSSSSSSLSAATTATTVSNNAADNLVPQLTVRTQYLHSLQWISQVQGSSSSTNGGSSNRRSTRA